MPEAQERVEAWVNEESPGRHADLAAGFAAGSWLGGYRLEEQVGAGGMAVVFRARDERLDRLVALKIMTPVMGSDEMFRQRFIRESRAAAAVDDPHIIPVYEAGEVGHVLFIAMRFVRGGDVRSLLRREGPLPPERVASIISPVASALDAAHTAGLVHRDVKPANILLDRRPGRPDHVYLSDFGLSKSAEVSLGLTAAGQFLGTPDYTAPEQIEGLPVDGRTDQYALACAVFELLTGQAPFHRSESFAAIWAHLNKAPPSLAERRPELPPAADIVMAKALAKAQADRYQTCWEFADALRDALGVPPYHLGSASDPGLPRAGSSPSMEAPHGAGPSPASAVSPPPARAAAPAPAGAANASGPGAGPEGPPPGEDTEASEVYAARSPAVKRDSGQPAEQRQDSTPDDQPTDPGRQAIPADPASAQEEAPSPAPLRQQATPPARLGSGPAEPDSASPPSPADLNRGQADLDSGPDAAPAGPDHVPASEPAGPDHAPASEPAGPDHAPAGEPAGPDNTPGGPVAAPARRPPLSPAQQPAVLPASRSSAPPQEPAATPAGPPRTPATPGDAPAGTPTDTPAVQAGAPAGPAVEQPRETPKRPSPPRSWPSAQRPQAPSHRLRPGTTTGRPDRTPRPPASFGRPGPAPKATSITGRPGTTGRPAGPARRGRRPRHRSSAYLALIGAGVLLAAAAAVVLTTVVTSKFLGSTASRRPAAPSAYSHRVFGRPQAGILSSVAFSPDGRTLSAGATGGQKTGPKRGAQAAGTTYLWDVKTGARIEKLSPGGGAEAFSPNGSILATAGGPGNDTTYLWEVAAKRTIAVLSDHHDSSVESVAFSADGRTLAVNDANGTVYVWALGRGGEVAAGYHPGVLALPGGVKSDAIAFSRRGATLAMGGANGQVYLWSEAAGTVTRTLKPPGNPAAVTSVAFSPDGRALAAGENGGVTYVWHLASRTRLSLPDTDGSDIESVAFSPDSKWVATGAANGKTYLWHLPATKPFATLTNPKGPASGSSPGNHGTAVFSVAFSPGGTTLATTDQDGFAFLWKVKVR